MGEHIITRLQRLVWIITILLGGFLFLLLFITAKVEAEPRNIVIIVTDDQVADTWVAMPRIRGQLVNKGLEFNRAYITTPLCCPSRSSIITGLYNANNGVKHNRDPLLVRPTLFADVKAAGYQVGIVGKLLNTYVDNKEPWSQYFDFKKIHETRKNFNFRRPDVNGEVRTQHIHSLYKELVEQFFLTRDQTKPFLFYFAPWTPHRPATPEAQDLNYFGSVDQNSFALRQLEALRGLDRVVDLLLSKLPMNNTIVVYLSDNGLMLGQHGLSGKGIFYEPAIRVPFVIRADGLIQPGKSNNLISNIDILPTVFSMAGLPVPAVDGINCMTQSRDYLRLQSWGVGSLDPWRAVHTGKQILVKYRNTWQQFDVINDPQQLSPVPASSRLKSFWLSEFRN